jgi:hypothetical protein
VAPTQSRGARATGPLAQGMEDTVCTTAMAELTLAAAVTYRMKVPVELGGYPGHTGTTWAARVYGTSPW